MQTRLKRILSVSIFVALIPGVIYILWGKQFLSAYDKYKTWQSKYIQLKTIENQLRLKVYQKKYFVRKLLTDPTFRDQVIHEQDGYLNANECVVRFKPIRELQPESDSTL